MVRDQGNLFLKAAIFIAIIIYSVSADCDTIYLPGGIEFQCYVHGQPGRPPKVFPDFPDFIEFSVGTWTQALPTARVLRWEADDKYTPPEARSEAETKLIKEVQEKLRGNLMTGTDIATSEILSAKVVYLSNYADIGRAGDVRKVRISQDDKINAGQWLSVLPNSRVTLEVGGRVLIGGRDRTEFTFKNLIFRKQGNAAVYEIDYDITHGKTWVEVKGLQPGEKIDLQVSGWRMEILRDSLLAFEGEGGDATRKFALIYGRGDSASPMTVKSTAIAGGGTFAYVGRQYTYEGSVEGEITTASLPADALEEWDKWTEFKPIEFNLDFRVVHPDLERFQSEDIQYSLPEDLGVAVPPPRDPIVGDLVQTVFAIQAGLDNFRKDVGRYPSLEEGLKSLFEGQGYDGWKGPYVDERIPLMDWWNQPLNYRIFGEGENAKGIVYSFGPNKVDNKGLGDDVR